MSKIILKPFTDFELWLTACHVIIVIFEQSLFMHATIPNAEQSTSGAQTPMSQHSKPTEFLQRISRDSGGTQDCVVPQDKIYKSRNLNLHGLLSNAREAWLNQENLLESVKSSRVLDISMECAPLDALWFF